MGCSPMSDGEPIPPVVLYSDGETYWLVDGFHRVQAARTLGWEEIEAEIVSGTLDEQNWIYSVSSGAL
jgi:uncharacterized ParB-like nuclease family protein